MAEKRPRYRNTRPNYSTGYLPEYDGNAARRLERWEEEAPKRRSKTRHRSARKMVQMEVRQAGKFAPFAVAGMFAVCLLAVLMLNQYATLVAVNDSVVSLRFELTTLQGAEAKLLTQYELAYDLQSIETQFLASGEMIKPQSNQIQTIELTEPDAVEFYQESNSGGFFKGIQDIFSAIGSYF